MKKIYLLFAFSLCLNCFGQIISLKITGLDSLQTKKVDSIGYKNTFLTDTDLRFEIVLFDEKLEQIGFLDAKIETNSKNENKYEVVYDLGKKYDFIHIYIGNDFKDILGFEQNIINLKFTECDQFFKKSLITLGKKGFPMAKVFLKDFEVQNNSVNAKLMIEFEKKRMVNEIVFNGYPNFSSGFKKQLNSNFVNSIISQENVATVYRNIQQIQFIKQTKFPELLFTKDSTKIYVYIEKQKANSFDGFIGFTNSDSKKLIFNGYLDLGLLNVLNSGEKIILNWKSDGKDQKTFNLSSEFPFVFKSKFGIKTQLNIFKQDSTFQNSQTSIEIGYYFNFKSKLFLGYQNKESSDIKNQNTFLLNDFKNQFTTINFEYSSKNQNSENMFFEQQSMLFFKTGIGKRDSKFETNNQFFIHLNLEHNFFLNKKNIIKLRSNNYHLQSSNYLTNEQYRFGGINSIRGFNENSLQTNTLTSILTEYQYLVSPNLYLHSVTDFGYFQDKTTNLSGNLYGIGIGFALNTKNGILNLIYANGNSTNQNLKISNSIVQISLKTKF